MAHIYLVFDFAKDEEKLQQARHKLEGWKQAFRLDKKLLYKMERVEATAGDGDGQAAKTEKAEKGKGKKKAGAADGNASSQEADLKLLVRLAFSGHEKLTEQRWVERIPAEEPFQGALPRVVKSADGGFEAVKKQFEELD